jgi:hypothetical protein
VSVGEGGLHRGKLNEMDQLFSASGNEWRCATLLEKEVPGKADFDSGTNQMATGLFPMFLILHDGRKTDRPWDRQEMKSPRPRVARHELDRPNDQPVGLQPLIS